MSNGALLLSSDVTLSVTVASMSSDTGITSYYGYGSGAWKAANIWNPNNGSPSGACTPSSLLVRNIGLYLPIHAVYANEDVLHSLSVVVSHSTVTTLADYTKAFVRTEAGVFETSSTLSIFSSTLSGTTYYEFRFGGFPSNDLWTFASNLAQRTVILRR